MMTATLLSILLASGLAASTLPPRLQPIEPVDIPPSIQQDVDMIYIDPEIAPAVRKRDELLQDIVSKEGADAPVDLFLAASPIFTDLRRGLVRYRMKWGSLPQMQIESGPVLKAGMEGERVALLRERLGLHPGKKFDDELGKAVKLYQEVHALKSDGVAGEGTIASLNLGAEYYETLLKINLERARRLPGSAERGRYIVVDAGAAQMYLFENGKVQDSMKVIVGKPETATPMMAALMRYASVNPYWNVPPELVQSLIAPRVLSGGLSYLEDRRYEVLSDWTEDATLVDPATVDWAEATKEDSDIRVRQRPGPGNSMGDVKFMMPNDFGIYLHDTPDKSLFAQQDRWISNGCVRVEDARRLSKWLFGDVPSGTDPNVEEKVDLESPVPVYITYMTAGSSQQGLAFRKDRYGRDATLLASYFDRSVQLASLDSRIDTGRE